MEQHYRKAIDTAAATRDAAEAALDREAALVGRFTDPAHYLPDDGLIDAVDVSLTLGRPLLVTGEPGTGKTQLANSVAYHLSRTDGMNVDPTLLRFQTKSTSQAGHLFYTYDTLGRFGDAQLRLPDKSPSDYLEFQALGIAVLWSRGEHDFEDLLPPRYRRSGEPCRSVVLIDEIDKAPRDFPNDILQEIEDFSFRIAELDAEIESSEGYRPIVVITSNSEKHLPDAFLRRCIFYNIPFPDARLPAIVRARLEGFGGDDDDLLNHGLAYLSRLRGARPALEKKPGTAELLDWLSIVGDLAKEDRQIFRPERREVLERTLTALVKTAEDLKRAGAILQDWLEAEAAHG